MEATATKQPTVVLTIQGDGTESHVAFNERGEIIETVEHVMENGVRVPDWSAGGIADNRGAGGEIGFHCLHRALSDGECNARLCGFEIRRLSE
jgi:hypothetical protein